METNTTLADFEFATTENFAATVRSFDWAPMPMAILKGPEFVIVTANAKALELWGMQKSEVFNRTYSEVFPDASQELIEIKNKVLRTGKRQEIKEALVNWKTGRFFFNATYDPIINKFGQTEGIIVIGFDVTESVLIKKHLQDSEERFRNLIMSAQVGIIVLKGHDFIVEIVNDSYLKMIGRLREDFQGKPAFDSTPEVPEQGFKAILNNVKVTGEPFHLHEHETVVFRNGKHETIYLDVVYNAIKNPDGTCDRVMHLAHDVTEKVLARKKIEESEARLRETQEQLNLSISAGKIGLWNWDLISNKVTWSKEMQAIFEIEGTLTVEDWRTFVHPEDIHKVELEMKESVKSATEREFEYRIVTRLGRVKWILSRSKLHYGNNGIPSYLVGVQVDITQQRLVKDELERLISQRTEELRVVNQKLAASNNELAQYAYVASHDLQEPLRKIQSYANLLGRANDIKIESMKYIERIGTSSKRMSQLIKELLNFSRLIQTDEEFSTVDLNEIVENIKNDFELLLSQKDGRIDSGILPVIEAVPIQMNQLFYNLINNALKFVDGETKPSIQIKCRQLSIDEVEPNANLQKDLSYYEIAITDNGIGFDPQFAEKIFLMFHRLHGRASFDGSGIGLAVCKKICINHKGDISATSEPGKGSTFKMVLPAKQNVKNPASQVKVSQMNLNGFQSAMGVN